MSEIGFLSEYIKENPSCSLEEVLSDEYILEELKTNNETLID